MINIFFIGLISFFTDISTEMVYPIIPLYLTQTFGATPALVGLIEGIAESVASLLKVFSGYISDRFQRKKPLAFVGYAAGLIYKLSLLLAGSWAGILAARVIDRTGKGIRTAPRDALVSESSDKKTLGKSFGLHKMLDMAGSALGILIAYFLLRGMGNGTADYKRFFLLSTIPAIIGLCMFFLVKEKREVRPPKERVRFWKNFSAIDGRLKLYLLVTLLFTLGNSSNAFLLLRAGDAGIDSANVILLFFAYNLTASIFAIPFGRLSDKIGRKSILAAGYVIFAAVYAGFAFASGAAFFAGLFALYGIHTAMVTGVERAFVAEIAPPELKGTMLGLQSTVAGLALLPASLLFGALWDTFGAAVPFLCGAGLSLTAAGVLVVFMRKRPA